MYRVIWKTRFQGGAVGPPRSQKYQRML